MAWIYKITNDINGKQYIGKTYYQNIQERWKEHCKSSRKEECKKRPLYRAINKYGIEHFHIEEVEYVPPEVNLEEREIYWIAQYNTYQNGYNATSQIVGYLTTGDLTYITSHDRSRQKIKKYDRVEILAALLKYYRGE